MVAAVVVVLVVVDVVVEVVVVVMVVVVAVVVVKVVVVVVAVVEVLVVIVVVDKVSPSSMQAGCPLMQSVQKSEKSSHDEYIRQRSSALLYVYHTHLLP